jgi:uncharacterized protein
MGASTPLNLTAVEVAPDTALGAAVLALNNAHARELSWLEPARLQHLVAHAFLARRIGALDAFLLAFDQDAPYDSPNFLWFRERFPRFVYVDRIVVATHARGHGLARVLYRDLFERVAEAGLQRSTPARPTLPRTPSMPRWGSPKSATPASTAEPRTCAISCAISTPESKNSLTMIRP